MPDRAQRNNSLRNEVIALKRERILEAAVDLFYEIGYENATLEAVADRLGATKPFIYSYYKSKTELLAAICERSIQESLKEMDAAIEVELDSVELLRRVGHAFALAVLRNQKYIAIMAREEKNLLPEDFVHISNMRREFDQKLKQILQQGSEEGVFEVEDIGIASLAIGGMVSWSYIWYRPSGRLDRYAVAERMTNLILSMVGVTACMSGSASARRKPTRARKGT